MPAWFGPGIGPGGRADRTVPAAQRVAAEDADRVRPGVGGRAAARLPGQNLNCLRRRAAVGTAQLMMCTGCTTRAQHMRVAAVALSPGHTVAGPVPDACSGFTANTTYPAAIRAVIHGPRSVSTPTCISASPPAGRNRPIGSCSCSIPATPSGSRLVANTCRRAAPGPRGALDQGRSPASCYPRSWSPPTRGTGSASMRSSSAARTSAPSPRM